MDIDAAEQLLKSGGWESLADDELDKEIQKHRSCIAGLSHALRGGAEGRPVMPQEPMDHAGCMPAHHVARPLPTRQSDGGEASIDDNTVPGEDGFPEASCAEPGGVEDLDPSEWQVPPHCIPIHANVTTYDWRRLCESSQFDVVMMDPPWQLATSNPTRGVSLGYRSACEGGSSSVMLASCFSWASRIFSEVGSAETFASPFPPLLSVLPWPPHPQLPLICSPPQPAD